MSSVMMLNHLHRTHGDEACKAAANRIRDAYDLCLKQGVTTRDLGGDLTTDQFTDALIQRLS